MTKGQPLTALLPTSTSYENPEANSLMCDESEYEVDGILDSKEIGGKQYYLVKWLGYPDEANTWEPYECLSGCPEKLAAFLAARKLTTYPKTSPHHSKRKSKEKVDLGALCKSKKTTLSKENSFADDTGKIGNGRTRMGKRTANILAFEMLLKKDPGPPIKVVNDYNDDGPPPGFQYVNDYIGVPPVDIAFLLGCQCTKEKGSQSCRGSQCACTGQGNCYDDQGHVIIKPNSQAIYECNHLCTCPPSCTNRVVQRGRQVQLEIFRAHSDKGWGVRAGEFIPNGTFISEYFGEVITLAEAQRREKTYGSISYLFDLDFDPDTTCTYTIDAHHKGNISHFINHSCDPNLASYVVFTEHHDLKLHRVALFAIKDILKGEELCFDYGGREPNDWETIMSQECSNPDQSQRMKCLCGSKNCRKWLWM